MNDTNKQGDTRTLAVLWVDDDVLIWEFMRDVLEEKLQWSVELVSTVGMATRRLSSKRFDAMILDRMLPLEGDESSSDRLSNVDGLDLAARIRSGEFGDHLVNLPVLLFTLGIALEDRKRARPLRLGVLRKVDVVDDYLAVARGLRHAFDLVGHEWPLGDYKHERG